MLKIIIRGKSGEGKTRTALAIKEYWENNGRKCHIIEGYDPKLRRQYPLPELTRVLIQVVQ